MSFTAPFRTYQPGDLFYGLGWKRAELMQALCKATNQQIPHGEGLGWIDLFLFPVNQYKKQDAIALNQSFSNTLAQHPKYHIAQDHQRTGIEGNSAWRAKSKGGLEWATQIAHRHVHFCLDGLNMLEVVNKSYQGRPVTGVGRDTPPNTPPYLKERSITGAELRWLYRWRANGNVQNYIQFWRRDKFFAKNANDPTKGFRACLPPWTWYANVWNQYNPKKTYQ